MQEVLPLVLYDGVCGLCNRVVRILLRIDKRRILLFAPLQGSTARQLAEQLGCPPFKGDSIILVSEGTAGQPLLAYRSDAALKILKSLGGPWRLWGVLRVVPRSWRDWLYDFIAGHRYAWFGKYPACPLPDSAGHSRFLP